jgi:hypothetical protein
MLDLSQWKHIEMQKPAVNKGKARDFARRLPLTQVPFIERVLYIGPERPDARVLPRKGL